MARYLNLVSPDTKGSEIIKLAVTFFSISFLLFGSTIAIMSSAQPQEIPSQGKQSLPQLQQQQLQPKQQQELQDVMQEKDEELRTKKIPNGFEIDEEFSVGKVQQILNQTLPRQISI